MVLVRSLGHSFQFKISFENQPYPRDFPWGRVWFYVPLSIKSFKWFDPMTTFCRGENWDLERNGLAQVPREWESQDLWRWLLAPGHTMLPTGHSVCLFLGRQPGTKEGYLRVHWDLNWQPGHLGSTLCLSGHLKNECWMKCTNSPIHLTNMNYMFTFY